MKKELTNKAINYITREINYIDIIDGKDELLSQATLTYKIINYSCEIDLIDIYQREMLIQLLNYGYHNKFNELDDKEILI